MITRPGTCAISAWTSATLPAVWALSHVCAWVAPARLRRERSSEWKRSCLSVRSRAQNCVRGGLPFCRLMFGVRSLAAVPKLALVSAASFSSAMLVFGEDTL